MLCSITYAIGGWLSTYNPSASTCRCEAGWFYPRLEATDSDLTNQQMTLKYLPQASKYVTFTSSPMLSMTTMHLSEEPPRVLAVMITNRFYCSLSRHQFIRNSGLR